MYVNKRYFVCIGMVDDFYIVEYVPTSPVPETKTQAFLDLLEETVLQNSRVPKKAMYCRAYGKKLWLCPVAVESCRENSGIIDSSIEYTINKTVPMEYLVALDDALFMDDFPKDTIEFR